MNTHYYFSGLRISPYSKIISSRIVRLQGGLGNGDLITCIQINSPGNGQIFPQTMAILMAQEELYQVKWRNNE